MAIKTLTGGAFQDSGGNAIALGTISFQLSTPAVVSGTGQVVQDVPITYGLDSSGNIVLAAPTPNLWGNDQLTPTGTFYTINIFNASGALVRGPENWVLQGTSPISLTAITPSTPAVSYSGAVLLNPGSDQTISTGNLTISNNLAVAGNSAITGNEVVTGSGSVQGGLTVKGGGSGTQGSVVKLFSSAAFTDDNMDIVEDTTFSTYFRREHANTPTYISAVPNGTIADGTAKSLFRIYGTDVAADPTNFESCDFESNVIPVTSPGGPLAVYYWAKTRISGTGSHRPILVQVGGINLMYMDPTVGCIVTCPASVDSFGSAADFITAGCGRGDLVIGRNGRALRSVNNAGTNTIALISADSSDSAVIAQNAKFSGKVTSYNGTATAGQGTAPIYGATLQKSESAADTNVLTFTPPAATGQYRINFSMSVSASASGVLGWTCTWKDSNGAAQAPTNLSLLKSGTAAPALTFTATANDTYSGTLIIDTDTSATNIVVKLTLGSGTFTAKVSASIERLQ